jgi:hypothetical protein
MVHQAKPPSFEGKRRHPRLLAALTLWGVAALAATYPACAQQTEAADLPDAPSALLAAALQQEANPPCPPQAATAQPGSPAAPAPANCTETSAQRVKPIISHRTGPLTPQEKAHLAVRDIVDPFNLFAITAYSGFSIALNAHSAYGPGLKGFGKLTGYSFIEDAQGEFFGTFAIPVLVHEDPRYRRMPGRPIPRRVLHAVEHTFVAEHDDGGAMPNYATLFTYPISAELSNLYVPGVHTNARATSRRIAVGIATDPVGNIVNEFLPDIASHIHIHVIFFQEILNRVASGHSSPSVM